MKIEVESYDEMPTVVVKPNIREEQEAVNEVVACVDRMQVLLGRGCRPNLAAAFLDYLRGVVAQLEEAAAVARVAHQVVEHLGGCDAIENPKGDGTG